MPPQNADIVCVEECGGCVEGVVCGSSVVGGGTRGTVRAWWVWCLRVDTAAAPGSGNPSVGSQQRGGGDQWGVGAHGPARRVYVAAVFSSGSDE